MLFLKKKCILKNKYILMDETVLETGEPLGDMKKFRKEELQGIGADLKKLKTDIKALDGRLIKIEGKLNRLDTTIEMFQVDIGNVTQKVLGTKRKIEVVERQ